ncbi:MAG TPA: zinc-ribbon domain-containing protein [Thermoplasmata archaeon]|nr:zinc-ribbon domain-containing protein [Thermoplasmata archaeon]
MPVCLHCGETGPEGALFCTKCGFTLPQGDAPAPIPARPLPSSGPGGAAPASPSPLPASPAPPGYPMVLQAVPYIVPAASIPGAMDPVPPPPNAKYCTRCGTMIAQPAVYCPVCQQPQP